MIMSDLDPTKPDHTSRPDAGAHSTPDETFTWTADEAPSGAGASAGETTGGGILESLREAVDDLVVKAGPTVRDISAKAAEIAASAADKAAPAVRRAGEATAEASGQLAQKSRDWASDLRGSRAGTGPSAEAGPSAGPSAEAGPSAKPSAEASPSTATTPDEGDSGPGAPAG
jgi:hypothetical protein